MVVQPSVSEGAVAPYFNPFQAFFGGLEVFSQGLEPLVEPLKGAAKCQLEVVGLMSRRAQACLEIPARLARCRTAEDFIEEQASFWRTALEQCSESSRRIMESWDQMAAALPAGSVRQNGRHDRDYITFPTVRDTGEPAPSMREVRRRVA
jgi:hypothetical protein